MPAFFKTKAKFLILASLFVALFFSAQGTTQENSPVQNREVIVRVLDGGAPVASLTAGDFKLFWNDKAVTLNGFAEIRKRIGLRADAGQGPVPAPRRLFFLLFNVSNHPFRIEEEIGVLFREIIRPRDRIMVMTNNFFLNGRTVIDPETEREKLEAILRLEARTIRARYGLLEKKLDSRTSELLNYFRRADSDDLTPEDVLNHLEAYLQNHLQCQNEFKRGFLDPTPRQYEKIGEYLRGQDVQEWVLAFFQEGAFPRLFYHPELQSIIRRFQTYFETASDGSSVKPDRMMSNARFAGHRIGQLFEDTKRELGQRSDTRDGETARKLFAGSDAAFHMQSIPSAGLDGGKDYESIPVSSNAENIFRAASQATGGRLIRSQKLEDFVRVVTAAEDASYRLTYAPPEGGASDPKIDVKVTDPSRSVIFADRQVRPQRDPQMPEAAGDIPEIGLSEVSCRGNSLSFAVSGVRLVPVGSIPRGRFDLQIKILDRNGNPVENRSQVFNVKQDRITFTLNVPQIKKRKKYDVAITVTDLNSGRNDIVIQDVSGDGPNPDG